MVNGLLITLREGLEAALVIGIILGYITKIGKNPLKKDVFAGVLLAVLASIGTAFLFQSVLGGFEGKNEEVFEGIFMLLAVGLLTPVILWMQKQSKHLKQGLEHQIDIAVNKKQLFGLALLSFLSVYREGVETVLFFQASAFTSSAGQLTFGGIIGLILAVGLAAGIFRGTARLNLKTFFKITGMILVFFAAGLFAHGIHELQEAGMFPVIIEHVWDINWLLNEKGTLGSFLKSLLGYNGNPSLPEVIGYLGYLLLVGKAFLFPQSKANRG